jgi:putative sporulation protein YtaF
MVLGISLANNLDNTGVGIAYGVARIRLPLLVNMWISVITFAITASSVGIGDCIGRVLPLFASKGLSAVILCAIGFMLLRASFKPNADAVAKEQPLNLHLLQDPVQADMDFSRHIDYKEGAMLGVALSINNVGGGLSAGLIHLSIFWTALLSAAFSFLVLWGGGVAGRRLATGRLADMAPAVAGILLIAIGLAQFRS